MRKKSIVLSFILIAVLFLLVACSKIIYVSETSQPVSETTNESVSEIANESTGEIASSEMANETTGKLSDIKVSIDEHDIANTKGQYKIVVHVKNTSSDMFWGNVKIESIDVDGKPIDNDTIIITKDKPLLPGQKTQAILWLKKAAISQYKYSVYGDFSAYAGHKSDINYTISKSQIGPGAGTIWIIAPDLQQETLKDISKELIGKYGNLQVFTCYFFANEADREAYVNYATLSWIRDEKPYLQYWDSLEKIMIE
jgi:hypothetical protein